MSDAEAPAQQDQPVDAPEAPETDQPTGSEESFTDFDTSQIPEDADREWLAQRYQQMQADYTRKTMGLGEQRQEIEQNTLQQWADAVRQNPSLLKQLDLDERALLETYGYAPEDPEDEFVDPIERELAEMKQWRTTIEQQEEANAQFEAEADHVESELEKLEQQTGQKFDEDEANWIFDVARTRRTQRGLPDVQGAVRMLDTIGKKRVEAYKESKKAPRAPGQGKAGSRAFDPKNKAERLDAMTQSAQEILASQD